MDLRGVRYERIGAAWDELVQHRSPYDLQPYTKLESVRRIMGNDHEADDVYLRRRALDRWRLRQHKQDWPRAVIDSLYWLVARYGVPYQLPALFIACLLLSIAVFSSSAVVRKSSPAGTSLRPETIDAQEAVGVNLNQILPVPGRCPGGTSGRPATNQ